VYVFGPMIGATIAVTLIGLVRGSVTSLTCEFGWCSRLTGSLCKPVRVARAEVRLLFTR